MTQYKLYYFDIKGMAEPIRLALAQADVPFEDVRFLPEQWPDLKPKMPFGQVPVLEMKDGFMLTQSAAILRYIGAAHALEADNLLDRAVADELATSWYDLFTHSSGAFAEEDPNKKVTWADFLAYNFVSSFVEWMRIKLDPYPHVVKFKLAIEELPKIKEWHQKHPDAQWSYWPSPFD